MREVGKNNHHGLWLKAMDTKFEGKGMPLGRERFEEILGGYKVRLPRKPARGEAACRLVPLAPISHSRARVIKLFPLIQTIRPWPIIRPPSFPPNS